MDKQHGITAKLYIIGPFPVALSLQESAAWQHNASQAALNAIIWIGNQRIQHGFLRSVDDESDASQDELFLRQQTSETVAAIDSPLAQDFVDGVRRWPSRDQFGSSPAE